MEQSLVKNKWNEILNQADDWWEELTDDDLEQINGSYAQLVYVLQERYNYSHEAAKAEVERRIGSLSESATSPANIVPTEQFMRPGASVA